MGKPHCKRCGQCCTNFCIPNTPGELRMRYVMWRRHSGRTDWRALDDIWLIATMVRFIGAEKLDGKKMRYGYRCIHYDEEQRLCGINWMKPDMCKRYPYYGKTVLEDPSPGNYPGCGYNTTEEELLWDDT